MTIRLLCFSAFLFPLLCRADEIASSGGQLGPGDRAVLSVDIPGFVRVQDDGVTPAQTFFAPRGSVLWIDGKLDTNQTVVVHFSCVAKGESHTRFWCTDTVAPSTEYEKAIATLSQNGVVDNHTQYRIKLEALKTYAISSVGSQYGVLLVPYKFHLSDNSFSSGVTLGGYYSYAITSPGISWGPVVSAGLGVVPVATTGDNGPTTENKAAVSAAVGLLLTFSKTSDFQIGILAGWDWLGKDAQYEHEGKTWVALSFGVPLTK